MAGSVSKKLEERGIEHHLSMPGSPQQNGKAEQFNHTVKEKALSMLHAAGLSLGFWECAVQTAAHIYNHTPTRTLSWHTPYEVWHSGQVPDVSHLHIFGCKAYMHVPDDKRHALDVKAIEMMLVGYEPGSKGYRLWDKHTHSLRLSRDVTFDKSMFPSRQGAEPRPALLSPAPNFVQAPLLISPAPAVPNPRALPQVVPTSTPVLPPVSAEPDLPATLPVSPNARPPSCASSMDSKDRVSSILRPDSDHPMSVQPVSPHLSTPSPLPSTLSPLPSTPEQL
jgi:hypothetical protein